MVPVELMAALLLSLPVYAAGKEKNFKCVDTMYLLPWPKGSADDEVA